MMKDIHSILSYWFGENINTWSKTYPLNTRLWFKVNENVDQEIKIKFEKYVIESTQPNSDLYQRWQTTDQGRLALIILLDQFTRNMYRGTAKMFEFDSLALSIALNIVNDVNHVNIYSLPERLFIYLPLIHSEDLAHTKRGAELSEQLASEVTQRDIRRRYATNAAGARTHQQVIETFGRYPRRNAVLGRESTPEEEEYLKTARNGSVKSVQRVEKMPTPVPTQSRLKILVLHGCPQNSLTLKRSAKKLFKSLNDIATFHFANAPLPYNPTGEVREQLVDAFGDGNLPETNYQRQWWNASKDNRFYHHIDVSLQYIDKLFKSDGPFDGIFGFSQGAALGGVLCGLQPFGNVAFNFAILISGFASRAEAHEKIMQPNAIKNISSLHIYGVQDVLISNDRTLQLARVFEKPVVVSHPGGHFTPNTWPNDAIRQFLIEQQTQHLAILADPVQFQSLNTFEEKLEATIVYHRKSRQFPIVPIGLSNSVDNLDDAMLHIWCQRTTFHDSELDDTFFRNWILLYLKKPGEILSFHLHFLPKYGSWRDVRHLYLTANQMRNELPAKDHSLLEKLQSTCVKLFGDQLKIDHRIVLNQPDESANEQEEEQQQQQMITTHNKTDEWISNCAKEAPRITNARFNPSSNMAKEIAKYLYPTIIISTNNPKQYNAEKGYVYQLYKRLISSLCQLLNKASPNFVNEQIRSRIRKDRAFQFTKEQRERLLNAPPSSYITNPEPEPVVPCSLTDLQPLFEHLIQNKTGPTDDNQSIVFTRGAIMTGGRLDLCKQVVGPQGIRPLLDAMKNSSVVNRLLLGNNIVGLPGAQAISEYIRCNADSNIDTWYIAGNQFDSECMTLICDALAHDKKVKALWLKRNPILADGVVPIARMLTTNQYLQTLDLLNTGLLDQGCEILFSALKSNRTLRHLYMDTNGLTVKSGRNIRSYFEQNQNRLESLYLSCNAFGDAGACEIAAGLKFDHCLTRLGLASNCIGAEGARALADALLSHPSLQQLNLGFMKATILLGGLDNVIGDEGASEISRLIQTNRHIRSIDLTFNGISQRGLMQLRDALKENRTMTTLKVIQFGQVHNEITKEEINTILEQNKIEWAKQVLGTDVIRSNDEYLKKGQELNEAINFPEHVMEIISYYRTH